MHRGVEVMATEWTEKAGLIKANAGKYEERAKEIFD